VSAIVFAPAAQAPIGASSIAPKQIRAVRRVIEVKVSSVKKGKS
jgi:hypothetical protein